MSKDMGAGASRSARWKAYDAIVSRPLHPDAAPAFAQEILQGGLWSIQVLHRPTLKTYGWLYRIFNEPPKNWQYEPGYNGWPGDHRGWMQFQTKEDARDFYKYATRRMSFEEYRTLPHRPMSDVRIDMDDNGDFIEPKATGATP